MSERLINIISNSCNLFKKFGIKSVSMDDIAQNCGISKKTLYELVDDKRDLVTKVLDKGFHKPHIHQNIDFDGLNAIEVLFKVYEISLEFFKDFNLSMEFDLKKYYPDLYSKAKRNRESHLYNNILSNIKQGQKEGLYRTNFNAEMVTKFHVHKIESVFKKELFEDDNYTSVEIFKELFSYHFYSIANEKGRVLLEEKIKTLDNENIK